MRVSFWFEHLSVVGVVLLLSFCIVDEEPIFDLSDFNLIHVWVLVGCVVATYFDLLMRARSGQFVAKDTTSMVAAFTFTWGLENYIRVLLLIFCLHTLMPLEVDLLECVELYQAWGAWVVAELLPAALLLLLLVGGALHLNLLLTSGNPTLMGAILFSLCVGQLVAVVWLAWDLVTAGLSNVSAWEEAEVFYLQPKSGLAFDRALGVSDQFEWHRERAWPYSLRFEDLYFFFFQLLLVWDLLCCLFFWCCTFATFVYLGDRAVSYTQVSLGLVWLEHVCVAIVIAYAGLLGVGLRVWLHLPFEFGGSWF